MKHTSYIMCQMLMDAMVTIYRLNAREPIHACSSRIQSQDILALRIFGSYKTLYMRRSYSKVLQSFLDAIHKLTKDECTCYYAYGDEVHQSMIIGLPCT